MEFLQDFQHIRNKITRMQNMNVTWFWFIQFKILVPMAWLKKYGNPEVQIPTFFATANHNKTKYSEPWEQEKKKWIKIFESKSTDVTYWTSWTELLSNKVHLQLDSRKKCNRLLRYEFQNSHKSVVTIGFS